MDTSISPDYKGHTGLDYKKEIARYKYLVQKLQRQINRLEKEVNILGRIRKPSVFTGEPRIDQDIESWLRNTENWFELKHINPKEWLVDAKRFLIGQPLDLIYEVDSKDGNWNDFKRELRKTYENKSLEERMKMALEHVDHEQTGCIKIYVEKVMSWSGQLKLSEEETRKHLLKGLKTWVRRLVNEKNFNSLVELAEYLENDIDQTEVCLGKKRNRSIDKYFRYKKPVEIEKLIGYINESKVELFRNKHFLISVISYKLASELNLVNEIDKDKLEDDMGQFIST